MGAANPAFDSYPKQLERMLRRHFPDKKIQCFFDQTIGQNTSEILLKLPLYIKKYNPQIVIFMVGVNNWWNLDRSNILLFNKNEIISDFTIRILSFLDKFRLWKLIKWLRLSLGLYKERWNYFMPAKLSESQKLIKKMESELSREYEKRIYRLFNELAEHDIKEMVKICKENRIKVIICSYPMEAIGNLYNIQRKIAKEFNIPFADNYRLFQKIPENELKGYLSKDGWHPNEKGYTLVAKNIYNVIIKNKLIK